MAKLSEYVRSGQVFFGCEPGDELIMPFLPEHAGKDAMLFASDHLHFDALFVGEKSRDGQPHPGLVATFMARKSIPGSAKRKMVLDNRAKSLRHGSIPPRPYRTPVTRPEPEEAGRALVPRAISARV